MNKFLLVSIFLFLAGFLSFSLAIYSYYSLQNVIGVFSYYGLQEKDLSLSKDVAETIFNLKFGIVKFSILGLLAWILGIIFYWKRSKKEIVK